MGLLGNLGSVGKKAAPRRAAPRSSGIGRGVAQVPIRSRVLTNRQAGKAYGQGMQGRRAVIRQAARQKGRTTRTVGQIGAQAQARSRADRYRLLSAFMEHAGLRLHPDSGTSAGTKVLGAVVNARSPKEGSLAGSRNAAISAALGATTPEDRLAANKPKGLSDVGNFVLYHDDLDKLWAKAKKYYPNLPKQPKTRLSLLPDGLTKKYEGVSIGDKVWILPEIARNRKGDSSKTLPLHEWAHSGQHKGRNISLLEQGGFDRKTLAEGGADAFQQNVAKALRIKPQTGGDYGPYVKWVRQHLGDKWINQGQFK